MMEYDDLVKVIALIELALDELSWHHCYSEMCGDLVDMQNNLNEERLMELAKLKTS